jgi:hypothetical protein
VSDTLRAPAPRPLLWPMASAAALAAAVFLVPFRAASALTGGGFTSRDALVDSLSSAFVGYWTAGSTAVGPDLGAVVSFWASFHMVKAALAGLLLVALVVLCVRTWGAYTGAATTARRLVLGAVEVVASMLAMVALVFLVANVQGAVAPLSSVLGLLPTGSSDPVLAGTITQVRDDLVAGASTPALDGLVHDFAAYHLAMACLGAAVTVGLLVTAVLLWRRLVSRRLLRATVVVAVVASALLFGVITAANLSTVAHPAPALLGFFEGGS